METTTNRGIETVPHEFRETIASAIRAAFTHDHERILTEGRWHNLEGFYGFEFAGMFVGCETDGYIHS